jgi:hypothetical protein
MQLHIETLCEELEYPNYYFAYGSNINLDQMRLRCTTAEYQGHFFLRGWDLEFASHANIVPKRRGRVAGVLWRVYPSDIKALDAYEGIGYYYRRRNWKQDGQRFFFYEMLESNRGGTPSINYLESIAEGYRQCGLDQKYLFQQIRRQNLQIYLPDFESITYAKPKAFTMRPKSKETSAS